MKDIPIAFIDDDGTTYESENFVDFKVKEKNKEIERLNKDNGDITKLFAKEREETKRLNSIIKEVRELIKKEQQHYQRRDVYINANDFLEILDKVEEKK